MEQGVKVKHYLNDKYQSSDPEDQTFVKFTLNNYDALTKFSKKSKKQSKSKSVKAKKNKQSKLLKQIIKQNRKESLVNQFEKTDVLLQQFKEISNDVHEIFRNIRNRSTEELERAKQQNLQKAYITNKINIYNQSPLGIQSHQRTFNFYNNKEEQSEDLSHDNISAWLKKSIGKKSRPPKPLKDQKQHKVGKERLVETSENFDNKQGKNRKSDQLNSEIKQAILKEENRLFKQEKNFRIQASSSLNSSRSRRDQMVQQLSQRSHIELEERESEEESDDEEIHPLEQNNQVPVYSQVTRIANIEIYSEPNSVQNLQIPVESSALQNPPRNSRDEENLEEEKDGLVSFVSKDFVVDKSLIFEGNFEHRESSRLQRQDIIAPAMQLTNEIGEDEGSFNFVLVEDIDDDISFNQECLPKTEQIENDVEEKFYKREFEEYQRINEEN